VIMAVQWFFRISMDSLRLEGHVARLAAMPTQPDGKALVLHEYTAHMSP